MSKKLKLKDTSGSVKLFDKADAASKYIKKGAIKTKDSMEQVSNEEDEGEVSYARRSVEEGAKRGQREAYHKLNVFQKQARRKREKTRTERVLKSAEGDVVNKTKIVATTTKAGSAKAEAIKTPRYMKQGNQLVRQSVRTSNEARRTTIRIIKQVPEFIRKVAVTVTKSVKAIAATTKELIALCIAGGWITVIVIIIVVFFGALFTLFGGDSSGTSTMTPVSAEVEAYTPLIEQYAVKYGISEYTELIKAIMMQESAGKGLDPMQASEGAYNTKYPKTPNGITDPEYSIEAGVQEVKHSLELAKVTSPVDMENIKLALQGYNFGPGYITWAVSNYGGYTSINAREFSERQAQKLGWSSYGDVDYVSHVLRYYPFGRYSTGGNSDIVAIAESQLGNVGGQPYWSWYGFNSRVEWCACFVSWCANELGLIEDGSFPKFASCQIGIGMFKARGQWKDATYTPSPGDIIFFDWGGDGVSDHVGIVESVENGKVNTIEGNSGDTCRRRSYDVGGRVIVGYGI